MNENKEILLMTSKLICMLKYSDSYKYELRQVINDYLSREE